MYLENGKPLYLITSPRDRSRYCIYKVRSGNSLERIGVAKNPPECYRKYANDIYRRMQND